MRFSDRLLDEGVFAQPVVFPTVAIDKSRLRTIVTAAHADEQLDAALAAFDRVGHELGLMPGESAIERAQPRGPIATTADRPPGARPAARCAPAHRLSPDSDVPIDSYARQAVERGIAEIAITDHVDFEPGAPAFGYTTFADRERDRPGGRRALGAAGRRDPLRRRAHLRPKLGAGHPRPPGSPRLRLHDRLGP